MFEERYINKFQRDWISPPVYVDISILESLGLVRSQSPVEDPFPWEKSFRVTDEGRKIRSKLLIDSRQSIRTRQRVPVTNPI